MTTYNGGRHLRAQLDSFAAQSLAPLEVQIGDDGSSDEDDGGDSGSAPIAPPAPLINTRQLNPNVDVVEPVAGAGNPAPLGSAVNEGITQGETQ